MKRADKRKKGESTGDWWIRLQDKYGEGFADEFRDDEKATRELGIDWDEWDASAGDIPPGCLACGGPYPDCLDSCPIGDPE